MNDGKDLIIHSEKPMEVSYSDVTGSAAHPKHKVSSDPDERNAAPVKVEPSASNSEAPHIEFVEPATQVAAGSHSIDEARSDVENIQFLEAAENLANKTGVEAGDTGQSNERVPGETSITSNRIKVDGDAGEVTTAGVSVVQPRAEETPTESADAEQSSPITENLHVPSAAAAGAESQTIDPGETSATAPSGMRKSSQLIQVSGEVLRHMQSVAEQTAQISAKVNSLAHKYEAFEKGLRK